MPDGSPLVPLLILPRFGTPRDLSRVTLGHEVGEVARRLRKPLMPWQQHAVDVALEVDPDTGELFYEEVVISVPRQSGKTTLLLALMIWRCLHMCRRLGTPQTVTYLAQSGKMARRKLEREFIPLLRKATGLREVPHSRARPGATRTGSRRSTTGPSTSCSVPCHSCRSRHRRRRVRTVT